MSEESPAEKKTRIVVNTGLNPGTLFDFFNTVLEWNPANSWGILANIGSTVLCTSLRASAEIRKNASTSEDKRKNWVVRLAEYPPASTGLAGLTQLIVAGTCVYVGDWEKAQLAFSFGVGDIFAAFSPEARAGSKKNQNSPNSFQTSPKLPGSVYSQGSIEVKKDESLPVILLNVAMTAEIYFANGLSVGQGPYAQAMFWTAAGLGGLRKIPFVSARLGPILNKPSTTFGLLAAGCVTVAATNPFPVALSYCGFAVAYMVIPTFESGGLYEVLKNRPIEDPLLKPLSLKETFRALSFAICVSFGGIQGPLPKGPSALSKHIPTLSLGEKS